MTTKNIGQAVVQTRIRLPEYWNICQRDLDSFVDRQRAGQEKELMSIYYSGVNQKTYSYSILDDSAIALIRIDGSLGKNESYWEDVSMEKVGELIELATLDSRVQSILLVIDSPGGTVAGGAELGETIVRARESKPVYAYAQDLCCSGAYWIASQCEKVYVNNACVYGSIGVFCIAYDYSQSLQDQGIEVHVIKAGSFKGQGSYGVKISPEHLEQKQKIINAFYGDFINAIASGRGLSLEEVKTLATGEMWKGEAGQETGLIDGIRTIEEVISELSIAAATRNNNPKGSDSMSSDTGETATPKAATVRELKAAFPSAGADFILKQMEASATLGDATTAYAGALAEENAKLKKAAAEAEENAVKAAAEAKEKVAEAEAKSKGSRGQEPLGQTGGTETETDEYEGGAKAFYEKQVKAKIAGGLDSQAACSEVERENPGLRQSYLDDFNASNPDHTKA